MELFLIYLWLKLDSFGWLLMSIAIFGTMVLTVITIAGRIGEDWDTSPTPEEKRYIKWLNRAWLVVGFSIVGSVFLPSSKDVAIIVGSSIAIDTIKSPEGQKISQLLRGKANELLDAEIKKLQPTK